MLLALSIISGQIAKISGSDIVSTCVRAYVRARAVDCKWREAVRNRRGGLFGMGRRGSGQAPAHRSSERKFRVMNG